MNGLTAKHVEETLEFIREKTRKYLDSDSVKQEITEAARVLVETRRTRASTDHWEYFCHGVEYVCTMIRCPDSSSVYRKRDELRRHLEAVHRMEASTIETVLDQGKRFPLYETMSKDDWTKLGPEMRHSWTDSSPLGDDYL